MPELHQIDPAPSSTITHASSGGKMGRAGRVFPWEHPWEHRTRSSFSFITLHLAEFNIRGTQAEVVAKGIVREVSVLSPTTNPAEPCAEVWSYRPAEVPPVARIAAPAAAGEVIHDWAPRELHALAWAEQARRRGRVVRIGTGQVLGVR